MASACTILSHPLRASQSKYLRCCYHSALSFRHSGVSGALLINKLTLFILFPVSLAVADIVAAVINYCPDVVRGLLNIVVVWLLSSVMLLSVLR